MQQIKKNLESKKKDLKEYIAELDQQIALIDERLTDLNGQIAVKEVEISDSEEELANAVERETDQMESMIIRAQQMYEKKGSLASELLAGNGGIGDFLNRAEFMEKLVTYDKEQWMDFQNYRKYVQLCEKKLEIEKDILDQTKENVIAVLEAIRRRIHEDGHFMIPVIPSKAMSEMVDIELSVWAIP